MSLWIKALTIDPEDLSSILRTHVVEGQNQYLKVILWLGI